MQFFRNKIQSFDSDILSKDYAIKLLDDHSKNHFSERKVFAIIQFICWYEKHFLASSIAE